MPSYVPILKGKEGEFAALETLHKNIRDSVVPLIEVPGVPYDYANQRPAKTLEEHVSNLANRLHKCWGERMLYIDFPWFDEERVSNGDVALASVLDDCRAAGVQAVPVVSRGSSAEFLAAAGSYSQATDLGACVRLVVNDFEEDVDIDAELVTLLGPFGNDGGTIDLLLDLEDLSSETSRAVLVARSIFSMITRKDRWRRIILAAASFPEDLSEVDAATVSTLPRREWQLWKTLQKRPGLLPRRDLTFGDYAIAHPVPRELDPRTMRMSASIRYTTKDDWLVIKGRNVRQYGFDQYFDLCRTLVKRPEYSGREFSWGDNFIADCAEGISGPGNATTWRKVGTNHHITLVATTLANQKPDS
jgi:hypothetical protein